MNYITQFKIIFYILVFLLRNKDLKDYEVWLGIHDVHGRGDEKHKQVLNVSQVVYGPEGSDLVLLKLARLVDVEGFVSLT